MVRRMRGEVEDGFDPKRALLSSLRRYDTIRIARAKRIEYGCATL
jgi:hypothetical protein